ncbi:MAG: hypothetical protein WBZ33_06450 [Thermoactinomyces sp.]
MQAIIGIPGCWKDRTNLVQKMAREKVILGGKVIYDTESEKGFKLDIYPHDPRLVEAFTYASQGNINKTVLDKVATHTFTLYVIHQYSNVLELKELMRLATKVLNAGGLAIKVETAGHKFTERFLHFFLFVWPFLDLSRTSRGTNPRYV